MCDSYALQEQVVRAARTSVPREPRVWRREVCRCASAHSARQSSVLFAALTVSHTVTSARCASSPANICATSPPFTTASAVSSRLQYTVDMIVFVLNKLWRNEILITVNIFPVVFNVLSSLLHLNVHTGTFSNGYGIMQCQYMQQLSSDIKITSVYVKSLYLFPTNKQ